jgi:hypothetical protein
MLYDHAPWRASDEVNALRRRILVFQVQSRRRNLIAQSKDCENRL